LTYQPKKSTSGTRPTKIYKETLKHKTNERIQKSFVNMKQHVNDSKPQEREMSRFHSKS